MKYSIKVKWNATRVLQLSIMDVLVNQSKIDFHDKEELIHSSE